MPRLSVREYDNVPVVPNGSVPVGLEPALASYSQSITGSSAMLQTFHPRTRFIRVNTDIACSIDIGLAPSASIGGGSMSAGSTEYFGVQANANHRVAVIAE